jgi:hypothetical protein
VHHRTLTFFDTTDTDTLQVKVAGDYLVSATLPMSGAVARGAIRIEVYVNGAVAAGSIGDSSYIRNNHDHTESSDHVTVLVPGLSANDTIEVRVVRSGQARTITMGQASLYVEKIDAARTVFAGRGTETTAGTDLNPTSATAVKWATEDRKDSGFTHSAASETITLDAAGDYMVFVNIPLFSGSARIAPQMSVDLNGTRVAGGVGMQGYSRAADGHNESSVHWSGLVQSLSASQPLTITVKREAQSGSTTVQAGKEFSIYVEKIDTSTGVLYARGNNLLSGTDWNPASAQAVRWETEDIKDAAK